MCEIPFVCKDTIRWVGNITQHTTCADIVAAIVREDSTIESNEYWISKYISSTQDKLSKIKNVEAARNVLLLVFEYYCGVERPLAIDDKILDIYMSWGSRICEVIFSIKPLFLLPSKSRPRHMNLTSRKHCKKSKRNWQIGHDIAMDQWLDYRESVRKEKLIGLIDKQKRKIRTQQERNAKVDEQITKTTKSLIRGYQIDKCYRGIDFQFSSDVEQFFTSDFLNSELLRAKNVVKIYFKLYKNIITIQNTLIEKELEINSLTRKILTLQCNAENDALRFTTLNLTEGYGKNVLLNGKFENRSSSAASSSIISLCDNSNNVSPSQNDKLKCAKHQTIGSTQKVGVNTPTCTVTQTLTTTEGHKMTNTVIQDHLAQDHVSMYSQCQVSTYAPHHILSLTVSQNLESTPIVSSTCIPIVNAPHKINFVAKSLMCINESCKSTSDLTWVDNLNKIIKKDKNVIHKPSNGKKQPQGQTVKFRKRDLLLPQDQAVKYRERDLLMPQHLKSQDICVNSKETLVNDKCAPLCTVKTSYLQTLV